MILILFQLNVRIYKGPVSPTILKFNNKNPLYTLEDYGSVSQFFCVKIKYCHLFCKVDSKVQVIIQN